MLVLGGNGSGKTPDVGIPNAKDALMNGHSLLITCVDNEYEEALAGLIEDLGAETVFFDSAHANGQHRPGWCDCFGKKQVVVFYRLPYEMDKSDANLAGHEVSALLTSAAPNSNKSGRPVTIIMDDIHLLWHVPQVESYMIIDYDDMLRILMLARPTADFNQVYMADCFPVVGVINGTDIVDGPGEEFLRKWVDDKGGGARADLSVLKENGRNEMLIFLRDGGRLDSDPAGVVKVDLAKRRVGVRLR